MQTKSLAFLPSAVLSFTLAWLLSSDHRAAAGWSAIGTAATALSLSWLFLGKTSPGTIILTDSLIRMLGIAAATVLLLLGAGLWVYGIVGLLVPGILSPILALCITRSRVQSRVTMPRRREVLWAMRAQWPALSARGASALYLALPVALVSLVSPGSVAVFAAGERIMRLGLRAMTIVPNAMQGWIGSATGTLQRTQRIKRALVANAGVGVLAAIAFATLSPFASQLIFTGVATIPPELAWSLAIVVLLVTISRATGGIALVAFKRVGVIAASSASGAIVGLPAIMIGAFLFGPVGGALGEIAAEGTVLGIQIRGVQRAWPRRHEP